MKDLSTNYFYRYTVKSAQDLTPPIFQRRLKKANQNTTTSVLFDLTQIPNQHLADQAIADIHQFNQIASTLLVNSDQAFRLQQHTEHSKMKCVIQLSCQADIEKALQNLQLAKDESPLLLSPLTTFDFEFLHKFTVARNNQILKDKVYWDFQPYQPNVKNSLTLKSIYSNGEKFRRLPGLEIWNNRVPEHYELEPIVDMKWEYRTPKKNILISFIIPSFNNATFLTNVVNHLIKQNLSAENFEIIVVEDGGTDGSVEILQELFLAYQDKLNLKVIYWSKQHPEKGPQNFFRAGLARNLACQYAEAELFFFLDSDMLVPPNFAETCLKQLEKFDVIQFERHHIKQSLSQLSPQYEDIKLIDDTYIEEKNYWSQLFKASNWMSLRNYWKYTCTYALGVHKKDFQSIGRFKKYYVSYGFEDTDLGYELYLRNKKAHLVQVPLLHLTAYDQMQYKNSQSKRLQLLRKTAALFYLQHLDSKIYQDFGNFYRFEKPLLSFFRDLI